MYETSERCSPEPPATDEEVQAAWRQFVRKLSGYNSPRTPTPRRPERAVREVTASSPPGGRSPTAPPRDREEVAALAVARPEAIRAAVTSYGR